MTKPDLKTLQNLQTLSESNKNIVSALNVECKSLDPEEPFCWTGSPPFYPQHQRIFIRKKSIHLKLFFCWTMSQNTQVVQKSCKWKHTEKSVILIAVKLILWDWPGGSRWCSSIRRQKERKKKRENTKQWEQYQVIQNKNK